jgi:hypothetical protein
VKRLILVLLLAALTACGGIAQDPSDDHFIPMIRVECTPTLCSQVTTP